MPQKLSRRTLLQTSSILAVGSSLNSQLTRSVVAQTDENGETNRNWPQYGFNNANTGYAPNNNGPHDNISVLWKHESSSFSSPPVVFGKNLYVSGFDDKIYAIDRNNGTTKWTFEVSDRNFQPPTIADGTIYILDDSGLYALNADNGVEVWQYDRELFVLAGSPTISNDTIYFGGGDVYALDRATGNEKWIFEPKNAVAGLALADGTVYFTGDKTVYAVSIDGAEKWRSTFDGGFTDRPAVSDGIVYASGVNSDRTDLVAIDATDGTELWRFSAERTLNWSPAVADNTVYVANDKLTALNAADGNIRWEHNNADQSRFSGSPVVAGDTLYVGDETAGVIALNRHDGTKLWNFRINDSVEDISNFRPVYSTLAVVDNTVYFTSRPPTRSNTPDDEGYLYALTGETESFDPESDGFGFKNWATKSQDIPFDPPHSHSQISEQESKEVIERWEDQLENYNFPENLRSTIAANIYQNINSGYATGGHCFGMVKVAQEYYANPDAMPDSVEEASEIEKPTGEYKPVGDDIDQYQNSQSAFLNLDVYWTARILRLPKEIGSIDYSTELSKIKKSIDSNSTIGIALGNSFETRGHQVLAYDYEEKEGGTFVYVYDPNFKASEYAGGKQTIIFNSEGENLTVNYPSGGYQRLKTLPQADDSEPQESDFTDGMDISKAYLFSKMYSKILIFEIFSPVSIEVDCPDGATLSSGPTEYISETATDIETRLVRHAAPAGEYEVRLEAEADGEYTLRVQGMTPEGTFLANEQTATIESGQTHEFLASVPEEDGTGSLNRIEGGTSDSQTGEGGTSDSQTGGNSQAGEDSHSSNTAIMAGLAGIGAAVAGVAGWLRLRNSE